jgi:hypothetical protein
MRHKYTEQEVDILCIKHNVTRKEQYCGYNTPMLCLYQCGTWINISLNKIMRGHITPLNTGKNHYRWQTDRVTLAQNNAIKAAQRRLLSAYLKRTHELKENHTTQILGYTAQELWDHLECQWVGVPGTWTIDHVFPLQAFLLYNICDAKIVNALSNLQPLSQSNNSIKGAKYDLIQFQQYCKKHNIVLNKVDEP